MRTLSRSLIYGLVAKASFFRNKKWQEHITAWEQSLLTQREYCRTYELSLSILSTYSRGTGYSILRVHPIEGDALKMHLLRRVLITLLPYTT
ncbi:IS66 family insertion sequence element accessory protein TnpA [Desulfogranum japonicum]|uniref:IS66 family insertion sequence element accessory protein TnpA n=1 Tax=Desulfogranum japonicum TaxID=231447 RepID=UPI0038BB1A81